MIEYALVRDGFTLSDVREMTNEDVMDFLTIGTTAKEMQGEQAEEDAWLQKFLAGGR